MRIALLAQVMVHGIPFLILNVRVQPRPTTIPEGSVASESLRIASQLWVVVLQPLVGPADLVQGLRFHNAGADERGLDRITPAVGITVIFGDRRVAMAIRFYL